MGSPCDLPPAYPDELWYSRLARYHRHSGNISVTISKRNLFGNTSAEWIIPLSIERTPVYYTEIHGGDVRVLYVENTLAPYVFRYCEPENKQRFLEKLTAPKQPNNVRVPAICRAREATLWYCPLCCKEDESVFGEMYWHRQHQITLAPTCLKHGCRTRPCNVSASMLKRTLIAADRENCPEIEPVFEADRLLPYVGAALFAPFSFDGAAPPDLMVQVAPENIKDSACIRETLRRTKSMYDFTPLKRIFWRKETGVKSAGNCLMNKNGRVERGLMLAYAMGVPPEKLFENGEI